MQPRQKVPPRRLRKRCRKATRLLNPPEYARRPLHRLLHQIIYRLVSHLSRLRMPPLTTL